MWVEPRLVCLFKSRRMHSSCVHTSHFRQRKPLLRLFRRQSCCCYSYFFFFFFFFPGMPPTRRSRRGRPAPRRNDGSEARTETRPTGSVTAPLTAEDSSSHQSAVQQARDELLSLVREEFRSFQHQFLLGSSATLGPRPAVVTVSSAVTSPSTLVPSSAQLVSAAPLPSTLPVSSWANAAG